MEEAIEAMNKPETYVPEHMRGGYQLFLTHGILPGSFGTAILNLDYEGALARADFVNKHHVSSQIEWARKYGTRD